MELLTLEKSELLNKSNSYVLVVNSLLLLVIIASTSAVLAQEPCTPVLTDTTESSVIDYDPFQAGSAIQKIEFELTNEGEMDCTLDIAVLDTNNEPAEFFTLFNTDLRIEVRPESNNQLSSTQTTGVYANY